MGDNENDMVQFLFKIQHTLYSIDILNGGEEMRNGSIKN